MAQRRDLTRCQEIARRIAGAVDDVFPAAKGHIRTALVFDHKTVSVDLPEHESPNRPFYETDSLHQVEIHVLRVGDVAMATNPFEPYPGYGACMEARSTALPALLIQPACRDYFDLRSEHAVRGGDHGAHQVLVGPERQQRLVNKPLRVLYEMIR